jgi:hypothetical protein
MRPPCTVGCPWRNVTRRAAKRLRATGKHSSQLLSLLRLILVRSRPLQRSIALSDADSSSDMPFGQSTVVPAKLLFTAMSATDDPANSKQ